MMWFGQLIFLSANWETSTWFAPSFVKVSWGFCPLAGALVIPPSKTQTQLLASQSTRLWGVGRRKVEFLKKQIGTKVCHMFVESSSQVIVTPDVKVVDLVRKWICSLRELREVCLTSWMLPGTGRLGLYAWQWWCLWCFKWSGEGPMCGFYKRGARGPKHPRNISGTRRTFFRKWRTSFGAPWQGMERMQSGGGSVPWYSRREILSLSTGGLPKKWWILHFEKAVVWCSVGEVVRFRGAHIGWELRIPPQLRTDVSGYREWRIFFFPSSWLQFHVASCAVSGCSKLMAVPLNCLKWRILSKPPQSVIIQKKHAIFSLRPFGPFLFGKKSPSCDGDMGVVRWQHHGGDLSLWVGLHPKLQKCIISNWKSSCSFFLGGGEKRKLPKSKPKPHLWALFSLFNVNVMYFFWRSHLMLDVGMSELMYPVWGDSTCLWSSGCSSDACRSGINPECHDRWIDGWMDRSFFFNK